MSTLKALNLLVVAVLLLAACGGDSTSPPVGVGSWVGEWASSQAPTGYSSVTLEVPGPNGHITNGIDSLPATLRLVSADTTRWPTLTIDGMIAGSSDGTLIMQAIATNGMVTAIEGGPGCGQFFPPHDINETICAMSGAITLTASRSSQSFDGTISAVNLVAIDGFQSAPLNLSSAVQFTPTAGLP